MPERKTLFLKILKAELEDCLEDIEDLHNVYERRHGTEEITDYVYKENEALLSRELSGLRNLIPRVEEFDLGKYESVEALASAVDSLFQGKVIEYEDPEAVYGIAKRKLLKVLCYVNERAG